MAALREWLAEPRTALIAAVAEGVRAHVAALKSRGIDFYGYALSPGEPYDIRELTAVANGESNIKVPLSGDLYWYYRFCVDEWEHWESDSFSSANVLLGESNERFTSMHTKDESDFVMDAFEMMYSDSLLDAILRGLEAARNGGVFGNEESFLAVWISDSGHPILAESVRRLNSRSMAREFMAEFG